jgi:hypothetical protein
VDFPQARPRDRPELGLSPVANIECSRFVALDMSPPIAQLDPQSQ